jgi:protein-tyrosine phosphatase
MEDPPVEVVPGIYIGSLLSIKNDHLEAEKISAIINLSGQPYKSSRAVFNIIMSDTDIEPHQMNLYVQKFALGVAAIETAIGEKMKVLVHCAAGINRSATLIGMYLIEQGMSYNEAFDALASANKKRNVDLLTNKSFSLLLNTHYELKRGLGARREKFAELTKKR